MAFINVEMLTLCLSHANRVQQGACIWLLVRFRSIPIHNFIHISHLLSMYKQITAII